MKVGSKIKQEEIEKIIKISKLLLLKIISIARKNLYIQYNLFLINLFMKKKY